MYINGRPPQALLSPGGVNGRQPGLSAWQPSTGHSVTLSLSAREAVALDVGKGIIDKEAVDDK